MSKAHDHNELYTPVLLVNKLLTHCVKKYTILTSTLFSDEKPASFLTRSFYSIHINRWLEYFNKEQIYLTTSQSILTNTSQVFAEIEDFLGVESYEISLHRSQLRVNEVRDLFFGFHL